MAHYATKRYNYWAQLGLLAAFSGAGLILGGIGTILPMIGSLNISGSKEGLEKQINNLLKPENAGMFRLAQAIGTLFIFLVPTILYARVCHVKTSLHLGFQQSINIRLVLLALAIMVACLPLVGALQELTELLPWSKSTVASFRAAEDAYNKQVSVIARMNNGWDYLISVLVIALLPAVVEEMMFRGALQNLLSRWFKMPVLAIIVTSILFSAVHGSYLGFLSRFALGFLLGWMYYRTGNIWLNIIAHFFNNAAAITSLYFSTKAGQAVDASAIKDQYPLWWGLISIMVLTGLFILFDKVGKKTHAIDRPGEEVLIPGYNYSNNPFDNDIASLQAGNQQ